MGYQTSSTSLLVIFFLLKSTFSLDMKIATFTIIISFLLPLVFLANEAILNPGPTQLTALPQICCYLLINQFSRKSYLGGSIRQNEDLSDMTHFRLVKI